MSEMLSPTVERCQNCGRENAGEFCAACGQKRIHARDLGLRHAWHHIVHEGAHADGKFLSSVKIPFTRPGQLTLDFFAGRRAQHVHPIRLFLLFGVAYFFLAQVNPSLDLRQSIEVNSEAKQRWAMSAGKVGLTLDQFLDLHRARMNAVFKTVNTVAILLHGFWLWVLFRKRRPDLAENMVTTLHLACFGMALGLVVSLLHLLGANRIFTMVSSLVGWRASLGAGLLLQFSSANFTLQPSTKSSGGK